jgi:hypothetical protein
LISPNLVKYYFSSHSILTSQIQTMTASWGQFVLLAKFQY